MAKRATRRVVVAEPNSPQSLSANADDGKASKPHADLIDALNFVSIIAKQTGTELETNVAIAHKCVVTFNGLVACGYPIADELFARPHTLKFLSSIKRAGNSLAISLQLDGNLLMQAGKFRAIVPCLDFSTWPNVMPDVPQIAIDDRIKKGLSAVGVLASESGQTVIEASILLQDQTCIATNRHVVMEYYHGLSLPALAIPKISANFICKVGLPLVAIGFGVNHASATFHYANGAWVKTQLYNEPWPDVSKLFAAVEHNSAAMMVAPDGFWEGVDALTSFTKDDEAIFFAHDQLQSHQSEEVGATYNVPGLPALAFAAKPKYLELIQPYAAQMAFNASSIRFQNNELRGIAMLKTVN